MAVAVAVFDIFLLEKLQPFLSKSFLSVYFKLVQVPAGFKNNNNNNNALIKINSNPRMRN